jgi:hypothetical protein
MAFEAGSAQLSASAVNKRVQARGPHFQLVPSPDFPLRFVLRPPTARGAPAPFADQLNKAVHLEWQKGRGAAWVLGVPAIHFVSESATFQLDNPAAVSESGLAAALDTLEDAALDECLSRHLTEGGDDRLHLCPDTGVNRYYCPPRPVPNSVVLRGSCTCSPPSPDGFQAARALLRALWQGRVSYEHAFDDTRARISRLLGIQTPHEVILHPSGSDAELIPLTVAAARAALLGCSGVVSIVVAAGEVGSGTAPAAAGLHFSAYAPCGAVVEAGRVVEDFPAQTRVVEIKPRLADGSPVPDYDVLVADAVAAAEREQERPFFVVHAVDGSKTGLRIPSRDCLTGLRARLGDRMLLCMDACQGRSEAEEFEWFLRRGAVVLVTSSKFFGAPGFCGAVLVPMDAAALLAGHESAPAGLADYLTKLEVPRSLTNLRAALPSGPSNVGLLLRWACGIAEMELFSQQGRLVRDVMRDWVHGVRKLVSSHAPRVGLVDQDCGDDADRDRTRYGGVNSVVSIKFLTTCGSKHLDADTLKRIHKMLTEDASVLLPAYASDGDRTAAALQCFVGQPVKLGKYGVLRLAIGSTLARTIAATKTGLAAALADDARVLDKMMVLAKYCEDM